ncbi:hypothetical protein [Veillonella criceti]|uniref:Uncharacterized protein n=1 Tax=Veillonella criceti TaxID=103891 RepID=A0A380NKB6_9FIRM|nr:hypothetical protein [Veillonella criceti]SUP43049.1 Uncharacterised protein [Veillonella criceti]
MELHWKQLFINYEGNTSISSQIIDLVDNLTLKYMFAIHLLGCVISKIFLEMGFQEFNTIHMIIAVMSVWGLFSVWAFGTQELNRNVFYLAVVLGIGSTFIIQPILSLPWGHFIIAEVVTWILFVGILVGSDILNTSVQRICWGLLPLLIVSFAATISYFIGLRYMVLSSVIPLLVLLDIGIIWCFTLLVVQKLKKRLIIYVDNHAPVNAETNIDYVLNRVKPKIFKYMAIYYVNFVALLVMVYILNGLIFGMLNIIFQLVTGVI